MSAFADWMRRLNRISGVRGCMVVALGDGLVVEADLMIGVPGEAVAALAASLFARARRSLDAAGLGAGSLMQVQAEAGMLFVIAPPQQDELVLVVIADLGVNVGLVRVEAGRAVEAML